jgi:hypothetical protein
MKRDVPKHARPLSVGALKHPTNETVGKRDFFAWLAMTWIGADGKSYWEARTDAETRKLRRP